MQEDEIEDGESPFREKALERLSSPEQLDKLMMVITPKGWIALLCFAALLFLGILWGFFGSIPIEVTGKGIILTEKGLFSLSATTNGIVAEVPIEIGAWVAKGDTIAKIFDEKVMQTIREEEQKLEELIAKQKIAEVAKEASTDYEKEIEEKKQFIASLKENIPTINIHAYDTGRIIELDVSSGDYVKQGDLLGWAQFPLEKGDTLLCHSYFRIGDGEQIMKGMQARMGLENVDVETYGYLLGEIVSVSSFPVSDEDLLKILRNPQLVTFIKQGAPTVIAVHIEPIPADTPSGFAWTSVKGPNAYIKTGTICTVKVVTQKRRPISYLFPSLFKETPPPLGQNPNVYPG